MPGTELAKAYIQILPSAKDFKANLTKAVESDTDAVAKETGEKAGETFGGKLTGALKALVAGAAIKKIGEGIVDTISAGADYQQLTGGVKKLYEDAADTLAGYAQTAFRDVGMGQNQYMQSVTSFSAALINSFEGDAEAAAHAAGQAMKDIADNANTFGTSSAEELTQVYQALAKGNFTTLDNLNLGFGGTKEGMQALIDKANELRVENGELGDLSIEKFGDMVQAIHEVQTSMNITGTTSMEAGRTVSGSIGMLKASFDDFKISLTDDSVSTSDAIKNMITSVFGDGTENNLGVIGNVIPMAKTVFGSIPEVASTIFDSVGTLLGEKIPGFGERIESLKQFFSNVSDFVLNVFHGDIAGAWESLGQITDELGQNITDIFNTVDTFLQDVFAKDWTESFGAMGEILNRFFDVAEIGWDTFKGITQGAVDFISGIMTGDWARVWEGFKTTVNSAADGVQGILSAVDSWVQNVFATDFTEIFGPVLGTVFNDFKDRVKIAWDFVRDVFSGVLDFVAGTFTGNWEKALDGLVTIVKAPVNAIIGIVNKMIDGLNIGIDALNRFSVKVPDWVPGLGGKTFGFNLGYIGHIPQLATGGVLPRGQMGLLEGTGAEAVVPLDQNERWIREVAKDMNRAQMADGSLGKKMDELIAVAKRLSQMQMVLDSGKAVGALSPALDGSFGSREIYSERGLAY